MSRILLILILALIGYWLWKQYRRQALRDDASRGKPPQPRPPQRMVSCAHCGLNLPEDEAVAEGGRHYCSPEHRRLGGGRG